MQGGIAWKPSKLLKGGEKEELDEEKEEDEEEKKENYEKEKEMEGKRGG